MTEGIASPPRCVWEFDTPDSGRWLCLFAIATFGDFKLHTVENVKVLRATIAARLGHTDGSGLPTVNIIKHPIGRLRKDGTVTSKSLRWTVHLPPSRWPEDERPPAAPPSELLRAKIPAHLKRCLIGLWSFAEYDAANAAVYPTIRQVARRTGQTVRAVQAQFSEAVSERFVRRVGDGIELAPPGERFDPVRPDVDPVRPDVPTPERTGSTTRTSRGDIRPDYGMTPQRTHTKQLPCDQAITLQTTAPAQGALFDDTSTRAEPKRRRDLPGEVLAYFNEQVASVRSSAGKDPGRGLVMTDRRLVEIAARLADVRGGDDDKVNAAKRVIDVQIYQVRQHGTATTEAAERDWKMLRTSTLFGDKNFTKWLDRWSEDGKHELWWQPKTEAVRRSSDYMLGSGLGSAAKLDADRERHFAELRERGESA